MAHKGFTAVETLLTLGIIAITAGVSAPLYRTYQLRSDLDTAIEQSKHALERAQVLARAGQNDSLWGYAASEGILFQGEAFAIREPALDELYVIPGTVRVSGLTEVVFQRVSGEPIVTGDIVYEAGNGERRVISVTAEGTLGVSPLLPPVEEASSSSVTASEGASASSVLSGTSSAASAGSTASTGSTGSTGSAASSEPEGPTTGGSSVSSAATCEDAFTLLPDGTVETTGTVDATVKVLGTQVSEGAGGTSAKVVVSVSTDEGDTWTPLFGGSAIRGGEEEVVSNLPSGTKLLVRVNGRHSWLFNRTFLSNNSAGHMLILRNGHLVPSATYDAFGNPVSLAPFLRTLIENGRIKVHPHAVLFLTELDALWKGSSKFQDAVIQVSFAVKPGSCAQENDPKVKIIFDRLENQGAGDMKRRVYVGEQAVLFNEDQWIPLTSMGVTMTDDTLVENVPGLSVERRSGVLRVLLHGSHLIPSGKEIVDARVIFDRAQVSSVEADAGQNAPESLKDGIVNDGPSGDEATIASDGRSVLYQTRVTTADDAVLIRWTLAGASSSAASGASSSSVSLPASASSASSVTGGEEQQGSASSLSLPPDPCAAAYSLDDRGRIVLGEPADVAFTVLGSFATYGASGPMIHVRLNASFDGGSVWRGLYNFRDILSGDTQTFRDVPAGSVVSLSAEGRYSWLFKRIATLTDHADRVKVLRPGNAVPALGMLATPTRLKPFLRDRIADGRITLSRRQVLALVELQDLDETADYQDAVVLISLSKPASGGVCGESETSGPSSAASSGASSASSVIAGAKMTICHYTPSDRMHPTTIEVAESAWPAFSAMGDRPGACESDEDGDGISNQEDFCPGTYLPESAPTEFMLFSRYALTGTTGIFREGPRKRVSAFSLNDTRGCSCEQLVDVAEGVREYYFTAEPLLLRELKSLFPFYTNGARQFGCGAAILRMARP